MGDGGRGDGGGGMGGWGGGEKQGPWEDDATALTAKRLWVLELPSTCPSFSLLTSEARV